MTRKSVWKDRVECFHLKDDDEVAPTHRAFQIWTQSQIRPCWARQVCFHFWKYLSVAGHTMPSFLDSYDLYSQMGSVYHHTKFMWSGSINWLSHPFECSVPHSYSYALTYGSAGKCKVSTGAAVHIQSFIWNKVLLKTSSATLEPCRQCETAFFIQVSYF